MPSRSKSKDPIARAFSRVCAQYSGRSPTEGPAEFNRRETLAIENEASSEDSEDTPTPTTTEDEPHKAGTAIGDERVVGGRVEKNVCLLGTIFGVVEKHKDD